MTPTTTLQIQDLALLLRLGWTAEERETPQLITLAITILFNQPPTACQTDELQDTDCYDTLIQTILAEFHQQPFKLIEQVAASIHHFIKKNLKQEACVTVNLTKKPVIAGFTGKVCFSYGDNQQLLGLL